MRTTEASSLPPRRRSLRLTVVGLTLSLYGAQLHAQRWDVTPRVTVAASYTDNVALDPPGQERDDYVGQINPGFAATLDTNAVDVAVDYRMQNIFYAESSGADNTFHQLQFDSNTEIVNERLFLDANATLSQNVRDASEPASSNLTTSESIEDIRAYSLSPYYRQPVGDSATGEARYTFGEVEFSAANEKSTLNAVTALLGSNESSRRFGWLAVYDRSDVDYDTGEDVTVDRAEIELRYLLTPTLRLFTAVGYETTNVTSPDPAARPQEPEGSVYRVGAAWAMTPRTNLELAVGENSFGNEGYALVSHQTTRTFLQFAYAEDITTVTEELLGRTVFDRTDPFGNPTATGELTTVGFVVPDVITDPFINESYDLTFALDTAATRTTLELYYVDREFLVSAETERFYGGNLSWLWQFGARTSLELDTGYQWEDLLTGSRGDESQEYGVAAVRNIGRTATGVLSYRHYRNDSQNPTLVSRENVVTVSLTKEF